MRYARYVVLVVLVLAGCGGDATGPEIGDYPLTGQWEAITTDSIFSSDGALIVVDSVWIRLTMRDNQDGTLGGCLAIRQSQYAVVFSVRPLVGTRDDDRIEITGGWQSWSFGGSFAENSIVGESNGGLWDTDEPTTFERVIGEGPDDWPTCLYW